MRIKEAATLEAEDVDLNRQGVHILKKPKFAFTPKTVSSERMSFT